MFDLEKPTKPLARLMAWILCLALALTSTAAGSEPTTRIDPELQPLLQKTSGQIPDLLRSKPYGFQGRQKIAGQDALSLILRTTATRAELEREGIHVRSMIGDVATVTVLPSALHTLVRDKVQAIALPAVAERELDSANAWSGVDHLRQRVGASFGGRTGREVLVGVIDSGIDIDHPNFEDGAGNTRILYVWDHTVDTPARAPAPYGYGTEWTAADINAGVATADDPDFHGTHVTGIAAGNGAATDENGGHAYTGVAPEANIIVVKADFGPGGTIDQLIDGMDYIFATGTRLGMPVVINLSLGTQRGAHEGTSAWEQAIDTLVTAAPGRAVVTSAGNDADNDIYDGGNVRDNWLDASNILSAAEEGQAGTYNFFRLRGYYDAGSEFVLHVEHRIDSSEPWQILASRGLSTLCSDLLATSTAYGWIKICNLAQATGGEATTRREFSILVDNRDGSEPTGEWRFFVDGLHGTPGGSWDVWLEVQNTSGNWRFQKPNPAKTLSIPATGQKVITVGAYASKICWTDINGEQQLQNENGFPIPFDDMHHIANFSSRGPTADGRTKPELVAPGSVVTSVLAQEAPSNLNPAFKITDDYLTLPGTSMAAPMVAGAVALLFEENPAYTVDDIRQILTSTARQDDLTRAEVSIPRIGPATLGRPAGRHLFRTGPSSTYGYGKLDLSTWFGTDLYETNDLPRQAWAIQSGATIQANVGLGDLDHFQLPDLEFGDDLEVTLTSAGRRIELTYLHPSMIAFTPCDGFLTFEYASAANLPTTGTETMHVDGAWPTGSIRVEGFARNGMDYSLEAVIVRPEASGVNNSTSNAQELPNAKTIKVDGASHSSTDVDYFEFIAYPGETLDLTLLSPSTGSIELRDSSNTVLRSGRSLSYTVPSGTFPFSFPRPLYLRVAGSAFGGAADYRVEIEAR